MITNYAKSCIRSFHLTVTNSIEPNILLTIPGNVIQIHLINCGIHKSASQNLYKIDFNGLLPDCNQVSTHSAGDNNFMSYVDLKFNYYGRIDGQFKISCKLTDGTLLDTGVIVLYFKFIYE